MEYKFRGLRKDGEGWAYGDLIQDPTSKQKIIREYKSVLTEWDTNMHEIVETEHAVIPETVGLFTGFESMWFSWVSDHDEEVYIYENQMIEVTFNDDILPTMCFITMNRGSWSCQSLKSKNKQQQLRHVIKHLDYCLFKDSKPTLNESPQD